jgi:hypothetical protein
MRHSPKSYCSINTGPLRRSGPFTSIRKRRVARLASVVEKQRAMPLCDGLDQGHEHDMPFLPNSRLTLDGFSRCNRDRTLQNVSIREADHVYVFMRRLAANPEIVAVQHVETPAGTPQFRVHDFGKQNGRQRRLSDVVFQDRT